MAEIELIVTLQDTRTARWHDAEFRATEVGFMAIVEQNHHCNFELWHEEDRARRDDMGFEYVYRAKRSIDRWNQQRNDFVEKMDRHLLQEFAPFDDSLPANSETPGMIVDRLSIVSLKIFHMREESVRETASETHRTQCLAKVDVLLRQRHDLAGALASLLDDCRNKRRVFRVYFQFKMYNDPSLNPALYQGGSAQSR
jgi:Protein of unknown function (DUF4254)